MGARLLGQASHEHPMANSTGYRAEHRLVMAEHVVRMLSSEEVVHHEDGDVANNDIANLMLFASQSEHIRHHHATDGLGSHRDPDTGRYAREACA